MDIYVGIGIWVFIYLLYLLVIVCSKKHLAKYIRKSRETTILKRKYDLNYDKISHKLVANMFGLCNGGIIAVTYITLCLISNIVLKLFITFIMLIVLILIEYIVLGNYFKGKEEK